MGEVADLYWERKVGYAGALSAAGWAEIATSFRDWIEWQSHEGQGPAEFRSTHRQPAGGA
jgi:hypothetical protein